MMSGNQQSPIGEVTSSPEAQQKRQYMDFMRQNAQQGQFGEPNGKIAAREVTALDEIAIRLQRAVGITQSIGSQLDEVLVRATGSTALPPQPPAGPAEGGRPSLVRIVDHLTALEGRIENLVAIAQQMIRIA